MSLLQRHNAICHANRRPFEFWNRVWSAILRPNDLSGAFMLLPMYQNTVYGLLVVWCMTIYLLLYSSLYSPYSLLYLAQFFAAHGLCCLSFASHASCLPCIAHIYVHVCMYHIYMYMFVCMYTYHKFIAPSHASCLPEIAYTSVCKEPVNACEETY